MINPEDENWRARVSLAMMSRVMKEFEGHSTLGTCMVMPSAQVFVPGQVLKMELAESKVVKTVIYKQRMSKNIYIVDWEDGWKSTVRHRKLDDKRSSSHRIQNVMIENFLRDTNSFCKKGEQS